MSKMNDICEKGAKLLLENKFEEAESCFLEVIASDPAYLEARFLLGNLLYLKNRIGETIEQYQYILERHPESVQALYNLGQAYGKSSRYDDAEACYRQILHRDPAHREALFSLADVFLERGELERSILKFEHLLRLYPELVEVHFKLGIAYKTAGLLEKAIVAFHGALRIDPQVAHVYNHLGIVHKMKGSFSIAEKFYRQALSIDPDLNDAHNNLGTLYHDTGRYTKAIDCFKKALSINPNYAEATHNLGNVLQSMGQYQQALEYYQQTVDCNPHFSSGYYHCGIAHQNLKNSSEAIACFTKALSLRPKWGKAVCALYHQLQQICDWHRLVELDPVINKMTANALQNGEQPAEQPFLSVIRKQHPSENQAIARAWSRELTRRFSSSGNRYLPHRLPEPGGRITIGYVTNRFRNAATAQLMRGLLYKHDRSRFRIHCYAYGPDDGSDYRKDIVAASDEFIDISAMGFSQAADKIHKDGVNILVDLKGYTRNNRLGIFAMRPSPIQVSYLGFTGTTGADFLDYIIADKIIIPDHDAVYYNEKLVYMPDCYMVNDDTKVISSKNWTRSAFGLPETGVVFGAFFTPYKIDRSTYLAWMNILKAIPESVLWVLEKEPAFKLNLKKHAEQAGVSPDRIHFAPQMPIAEHLARLKLVDIALDTWSSNGHTTTSDALWAGVPVVTMIGNNFTSRVAASLLKAIGMTDLIATNPLQYQDIVIGLASDSAKLETLKKHLLEQVKNKPLFDTKRFAKNLEYAYTAMWSKYLAGHSVRPIHVPDQYRSEPMVIA
ncbi:MAG: tetratricopeptide repeat protein [Desulfobacteraceae bacterium]|nr:tetratricopeptide repeat protein [Desulfobacteraceae bacterium]